MHQPDEYEESLGAPEKLVTALKRAPRDIPFIPPAVDSAVLRAAHQQLKPRRWQRVRPVWLLRLATAAAGACALLLLLIQLQPLSINPATLAREDINRDGRVDILDAFALARQLKAGPAGPGMLDINGDGVVDQRDVTAIAARAVQLPAKGGRS